MCCKRFIGLLGVVVLGAGKPLAAQEAGEEKPDQSVPAAEAAPEVTEPVKDAAELEAERLLNEARNLVILLGDDSYRAREDATKGLWDLGEVGIVAIREGVQSEDPEVAYRSRILRRRLMTGLTPHKPGNVGGLLHRDLPCGV